MSLDYIVDSLEGMDDTVKSLYVEKDGSFFLDVSGIDDGKELKGALEKERVLRRGLEKQIKKAGDLKSEDERKALEKKEEYKTLYESEKESNVLLKKTAKDAKKSLYADGIISELTTDTKRARVLKNQIISSFDFTDDGEIEIVGIKGVTKSSELISHLKKEYDFLIDGSKASGGGANGGDGQKKTEFNKDPIARLSAARAAQ